MLHASKISRIVPLAGYVLAASLGAEASYAKTGATERTSERFTLVGSIATTGKASSKGVAMIRDRDSHKTVVVKVGQRLSSGDSVLAIEKNRVIIGSVGSRMTVERDAWASEGTSDAAGSVTDTSSDTPYFGSAPEVNYDPNMEQPVPDMNGYPNSYPVDPGNMPPPPPPPPAYPYPQQNYGGGAYPQNFGGAPGYVPPPAYPTPGDQPMNVPPLMNPDGSTSWQAPVVNPQ